MGVEYHSLPLQGQGCHPWARILWRPQIARTGHEGSREGGGELLMTPSAHQWHTVWLHAWTQHHRHHIHCMPVIRKGLCRQLDTVHGLYLLYASNKKRSMPAPRRCTWPMSIWKRHLIMHPDGSSGGLFANLMLRSTWCSSYRACMKMPEAECVLDATRVKSSV